MYRAELLLTVRLVLVSLLAISVVGVNEVAQAQTPKVWNSATTPLNIELSTGPVISVNLQKWKRGYTLVVDAVVRAANATSGSLIAIPTVNGVSLDPSPSVAATCNGSCFVSARWVLDLDQANLDHPGVFTSNGTSGVPLTISLEGLATQPEIGTLLLTAKLEKKR